MPRFFLLTASLATILTGTAFAAGDPAEGAVKAYTCAGCHGIEGYKNTYPTYKVPRIGGQNAAYIISALNAYKSGERQHKTMNLHAEGLSDEDMADIAAFLESLGESN